MLHYNHASQIVVDLNVNTILCYKGRNIQLESVKNVCNIIRFCNGNERLRLP